MSGYGGNGKFLFQINITSELFLILHLEASNSVTPIFFLPSNFLSIGQLINPETSCLNANRCAKDKHLETNFEASFSLTPKGSLKFNPISITLKELSFKFTLLLSIFFYLNFCL